MSKSLTSPRCQARSRPTTNNNLLVIGHRTTNNNLLVIGHRRPLAPRCQARFTVHGSRVTASLARFPLNSERRAAYYVPVGFREGGFMGSRMKWAEIKNMYPDEWVAVVNYDTDAKGNIEGEVVIHAHNKNAFYDDVEKMIPQYEGMAVRYTGELIKNAEVPLLWQITHTVVCAPGTGTIGLRN